MSSAAHARRCALALVLLFACNREASVDDAGAAAPFCGDGVVAEDEECDDGNVEDGDGCTGACTLEFCGDGVVQAREECDEDTYACSWTCTWRICGEDGVFFASDHVAGSGYGAAVAVDGDTVVVGADRAFGAVEESGAVFVCERRGELWIETAKVIADDGEKGDVFGSSLVFEGDELIVGAEGSDNATGSVYVFQRGDAGWAQVAKLRGSDIGEFSEFGFDVARDEDLLVVGARGYKRSGAAYVFERGAEGWVEVAKLSGASDLPENIFGVNVDVRGDLIVVSDDDASPPDSPGSVHVYERAQGGWAEVAELGASEDSALSSFGHGLAIDDGVIAVGALVGDGNQEKSGSIFLFEEVGGVWTEVQKLQASDGGSGERFGYSMVIEGDALVVGAPRALIDGVETGAAYVFRREPGGWSEVAKLVPTDGEEDDKFGEHVALRGGQLLVSSPGYNGQGNAMGAAYLFSAP